MEKRSRLGRGLASLLNSEPEQLLSEQPPDLAASVALNSEILSPPTADKAVVPEMLHVELFEIHKNPHQPRKQFNEETLTTLAHSIQVAGVIQPIIVRRVEDHYEVIAGERRLRAAQLAGLATIPVIIRKVDPLEQSQLALIENIHREDLNPIDRASAYREIIRQMGLTHVELATRLGEERSSIGHYLRLLELPENTRSLVAAGKVSVGHAKLLTSIEDPNRIDELAQLVVTQQLSVRNLEKLIKDGLPDRRPTVVKPPSPHLADLERQLSRDLQMRAEVKQAKKGGKGKLILHYASLDQFDELIGRLGVKIQD